MHANENSQYVTEEMEDAIRLPWNNDDDAKRT